MASPAGDRGRHAAIGTVVTGRRVAVGVGRAVKSTSIEPGCVSVMLAVTPTPFRSLDQHRVLASFGSAGSCVKFPLLH